MIIFDIIKSVYKTFYFNFKAFRVRDAVKFSVICGPNVIFNNIEKNKISYIKGVSFKRMVIGRTVGSFRAGYKQRTYVHIGKNSQIIINDVCDIPCGSTLNVNGKLVIGDFFRPNCFLLISCENEIVIGNNCNIGWNTTIIDGDGHLLCLLNNPVEVINKSRPVHIGDNCWISAHVSILKGVNLADNTIVPYGSVITKSCCQPNVIFGGLPNKVIKTDVARIDFLKK